MKKYILLFLISLIYSSTAFSQEKRIAAADKKYDTHAYIDAIKIYESTAEKGYKSQELFEKLGNSFYFNSEFEKAAKWYGELFALNTETEPEYYYRYSQSLKSIGNTVKANEMLDLFYQKSKNDKRAQLYKADKNYLEEIKANSGRYKIENAGINSEYSDYGTALYQNKIVFTSARDKGTFGQLKDKWTGGSYTNLYEAELDADFNLGSPVKLNNGINSKFHEATPVFTKDGKTVYFTRNNYVDGKKGKNEHKTTLIKIYKATLENDKWVNITALPFTSDNYSTAHPALSPDEKTLYFASDMPGTIGQSDIFKVGIKADGQFSTPENLGSGINTEGKETFPYITSENEIYFASDGHPGLGGLDIFTGKISENGVSEIKNVGTDINSPQDDFGYIIDPKSRRGFFSSNKNGGTGSDDIYKFLETKKLICVQELRGTITDLASGTILPNSTISLFDAKYQLLNTINSDENGRFTFAVTCGNVYSIRAEKENYASKEQSVSIKKENGTTNTDIVLESTKAKVTIGDDLGKFVGIKTIYFDLNKADIRPEAALDLEKVLQVMQQYPTMKLDIRSHTDSRQSHKYNQALSDKRAKSIIKWLADNGVTSDRLTGKGYGETQLVNKCADGVKCSEEEHQMNRRSEFIIIEM
ncbi:OmpA family protein [Flavobacterium gelatinilyticum]|uniref:OmpA family protein n=1 Tax=Flavobacterium gelatinilyticum TaxID=3003260 RepID=UPI0024806DFA|nr:OmpA family protein [Flavobacterium gelatinilyticum]